MHYSRWVQVQAFFNHSINNLIGKPPWNICYKKFRYLNHSKFSFYLLVELFQKMEGKLSKRKQILILNLEDVFLLKKISFKSTWNTARDQDLKQQQLPKQQPQHLEQQKLRERQDQQIHQQKHVQLNLSLEVSKIKLFFVKLNIIIRNVLEEIFYFNHDNFFYLFQHVETDLVIVSLQLDIEVVEATWINCAPEHAVYVRALKARNAWTWKTEDQIVSKELNVVNVNHGVAINDGLWSRVVQEHVVNETSFTDRRHKISTIHYGWN